MLQNDRLLRALLRQPVSQTPLWMMRQAGRYLPEYRAVRATVDGFMGLCKNPKLAAEVTLQPLARYNLDAAIIFSDILTIPDAMGLDLQFVQGEGPKIGLPVRTLDEAKALRIPEPEKDLHYVLEAIDRTKTGLANRVPLIGFCGSPWTVASYMVEGGSSKDFRHIKGLLYREPEALHLILDKLTQAITAHLNAQIQAGCDAVMVFDSWGGVLTTDAYHEFSLPYMKKIVDGLIKDKNGVRVPNVLFTKNGSEWIESIAQTGCDAVGCDWMMPMGTLRERVGDKVALQGNLDPSVLYGSPKTIEAEVQKILASYGHGSGHVFNLGHGIHQYIDPENVDVLVRAVHEFSRAYHQ